MIKMHTDLEAFKGNLFSTPMDHPLSAHIGRICLLPKSAQGQHGGLIMEWELDGTVTESNGIRIANSFETDRPQHFVVGHLQRNYKGDICFRVYRCDKNGNQDGYNHFGQVASFDEVIWADQLN